MINGQQVPKDVMKKLFDYASSKYVPCNTYEKLLEVFKNAREAEEELNRFYFPCLVCGIPVILSENMINKTAQWMQSQWVCSTECAG